MARKCTHPRGYDSRTGRCPICKARKPGRPQKPRPSPTPIPWRRVGGTDAAPSLIAPSVVPAAPNSPPLPASSIEPDTDRASRFSKLIPPSPVEPAEVIEQEPIEPEEPSPEPAKSKIGYDWNWTAKKLVTGFDIGIGIAIDRLTDREPLDAGEEETNELTRVTAEYGEKSVGKIEAPLWLVFLIALVFFVLSKYSDAPKKAIPVVTAKPKPEIPTPTKATPPAAGTADTSTPGAAGAAATPETPRPIPAVQVVTDGNVGGATVGY